MTTLELAEQIATAVIRATQTSWTAPYGDAPTRAVLETLRAHSSWFCRVSDPEDGLTVDTPYEQVQQELYR